MTIEKSEEHVVDSEGSERFETLLTRHVVNSYDEQDYGIDYEVRFTEVKQSTNLMTPHTCYVQLKSSENLDELETEDKVYHDFMTKHLQNYFSLITPVALVLYDHSRRKHYWRFLHSFLWDTLEDRTPEWRDQESNRVHIPRSQTLNDLEGFRSAAINEQTKILSNQDSSHPGKVEVFAEDEEWVARRFGGLAFSRYPNLENELKILMAAYDRFGNDGFYLYQIREAARNTDLVVRSRELNKLVDEGLLSEHNWRALPIVLHQNSGRVHNLEELERLVEHETEILQSLLKETDDMSDEDNANMYVLRSVLDFVGVNRSFDSETAEERMNNLNRILEAVEGGKYSDELNEYVDDVSKLLIEAPQVLYSVPPKTEDLYRGINWGDE